MAGFLKKTQTRGIIDLTCWLLGNELVIEFNFGNCRTNIPAFPEGARPREIRVGRWRIPDLSASYGAGRPGAPLAIIGSGGYVEIAVNRGRADRTLGLRRGRRVTAWRP